MSFLPSLISLGLFPVSGLVSLSLVWPFVGSLLSVFPYSLHVLVPSVPLIPRLLHALLVLCCVK